MNQRNLVGLSCLDASFESFFNMLQCRELYAALKEAMERAAIRGKVTLTGRDLGGEFPVQDMESNQGGLLQVRMDGVSLLFEDRQVLVTLLLLFAFFFPKQNFWLT